MLLYRLILAIYRLGISAAALYNEKACKWVDGRKNWQQHIQEKLQTGEKRIWVHCSSLGEFEQGKPLIELLKEQHPSYKIVLTFFSPSGYDGCKGYDKADYVFYLPIDSPGNAKKFIAAINPSLALFVKYEFWHFYLHELKQRKIPLVLVSGAFRHGQVFFKWYGGFFRKMLRCFSHIHVQDGVSAKLLEAINIKESVSVTGDTRYDRVVNISANIKPIPVAEKFKRNKKILIAGSTWPDDEHIIKECLNVLPDDWKLIIAPHEIDAKHVRQVSMLFGNDAICYSQIGAAPENYEKRVLIIDNIGMLSSLYAYGDIAYIGGGFQKGGIHNVLEPAVFGLPVVFGPVYKKFVEAVGIVGAKAAFSVNNATEASAIIEKLASDNELRQAIMDSLQKFMRKKAGAAKRIMTQIDQYL